jgi:hypothetical protein
VVLNLLHGRLGAQGELNSAELVHAGEVGDRLAGVLGSARKTEGVGAVEGDRSADLLSRVRLGALEGGLLGGAGLGLLGSWYMLANCKGITSNARGIADWRSVGRGRKGRAGGGRRTCDADSRAPKNG